MSQSSDVTAILALEGSREIPAIPDNVRLTELPNGLTIIACEDHSAPVVSAQAWCKTGSINEGKWLGAGLSHVLEHMLFKGTTTRGAGRIDQEIHEEGGYMNAYTSFDRTVYWINVPNTGARVALDILSDIMQHATLPEAELAKEMEVIRREMDMNQDDPARRASRRLFETAYTHSPYRYTIIGYPDIFNQVTRADLLEYYREKYTPNNQFFVVVGDLDAEEAIAQIEAAFAKSLSRPLPPTVLPEEPKQTAAREVIEEAPIELGHAHFSWHIPDVRHPDVPILDVVATLLGGGRSSRLFQTVRERLGLVHQVEAWTYSPGNPGLFGTSFVTDPDQFEPARAAIAQEVQRIQDTLIEPGELTKAVKQFIAGTLGARKTMQGRAQDLGANWMAASDLNFSERYLAAVKRITPADVQRVAREYLTVANRTLYSLLPAGTKPRRAVRRAEGREHAIQRHVLPNGLRLLVKEDHRLPFVELRAVFKGGVLAETSATNGLSQLTARLLLKGTQTRSAEQLATEIESVGGSMDSYAGNNSLGVNLEVLSSDFATGLALLADVMLHPVFPAAELERERQLQLAALKAQRDQPLPSCGRLMRRALFGETGYGLDMLGAEGSVASLQATHVRELYQRLIVPPNCVLAIYGDVSAPEVRSAVERALAAWPASSPAAVGFTMPSSEMSSLASSQRVREARDKEQAVILVGFRGATLYAPDRYALEIIQESCSDLGSRLFVRVREQLGLAYYVGAQNLLGLVPGYFAFYAGTAPDQVARVEQELWAEVDSLRAAGLTPEELKRTKAKIIGHRKIARQDLGDYALTTALDELYGLGYANSDTEDVRYEAVSIDDVKAAAAKYLTPSACVVAVVGPERE